MIIHSRYRRPDQGDGQVARRSLKGTLGFPPIGARSPRASGGSGWPFGGGGHQWSRGPVRRATPAEEGKQTSSYSGANDAYESKSPESSRKQDRLVVHHWRLRRVWMLSTQEQAADRRKSWCLVDRRGLRQASFADPWPRHLGLRALDCLPEQIVHLDVHVRLTISSQFRGGSQ